MQRLKLNWVGLVTGLGVSCFAATVFASPSFAGNVSAPTDHTGASTDCTGAGTDASGAGTDTTGSSHSGGSSGKDHPSRHVRDRDQVKKAQDLSKRLASASAVCQSSRDCAEFQRVLAEARAHASKLNNEKIYRPQNRMW